MCMRRLLQIIIYDSPIISITSIDLNSAICTNGLNYCLVPFLNVEAPIATNLKSKHGQHDFTNLNDILRNVITMGKCTMSNSQATRVILLFRIIDRSFCIAFMYM